MRENAYFDAKIGVDTERADRPKCGVQNSDVVHVVKVGLVRNLIVGGRKHGGALLQSHTLNVRAPDMFPIMSTQLPTTTLLLTCFDHDFLKWTNFSASRPSWNAE